MANICIVCKKEVAPSGKALKIKEDRLIRSIRAIKNALHIAQNNKLFVCKDDLAEHNGRRKKFEKDSVVFGVAAVAIILVMVGLPLLGGNFSINIFLISILMGIIVFIFGAMFKYVPAVEGVREFNEVKGVKEAEKAKEAKAG